MTDVVRPASELVLYQTEDGRTRIECRFEGETLWLTQAQIAELFQKDVRTINEHLLNIFDEGELGREATIRKLRMVRTEGKREVTREIEHYNLDAILTDFSDNCQQVIGRITSPGRGAATTARCLPAQVRPWKSRRGSSPSARSRSTARVG